MNQDSSFLDACTASLVDDPELRLEVATELAGHLEDAASECHGDRNEAELRFGAPEELSQSLWLANRRRFSRRARIRFWIKWLTVPVLLGALYCSINVRNLAAVLLWFGGLRGDATPLGQLVQRCLTEPKRTAAQQLIHRGGVPRESNPFHSERVSHWRAVWEAFPEPEFLAAYLFTAVKVKYGRLEPYTPEERDFLLREIALGEKSDPDNALYPYMASAVWLRNALRYDDTGKTWEIIDEAAFQRALEKLRAGLAKPYCRSYMPEIWSRVEAAANFPDDIYGIIESKLAVSGAPFTPTHIYSMIGSILPLAGDREQTLGNAAMAALYYDAWKTLSRQLNRDTSSLIESLVLSSIARQQMEAAEQRHDSRRVSDARELARIGTEWREAQKSVLPYRQGGLFTQMGYPFRANFQVSDEIFLPDLNLSYALLDSLVMAATDLIWCGFLLVFGLAASLFFLFGRNRPALLLLPWRDCRHILRLGILTPLLCYWLWTSGWLGNREVWITRSIHWQFALDVLLPLIVLPIWFLSIYMRRLRRHCRMTGTMSLLTPGNQLLNRIPVLAFYLVCVNLVMGSWLQYRIEREKERDTLFFNTTMLSTPEVEETARLKAAVAKALPPDD